MKNERKSSSKTRSIKATAKEETQQADIHPDFSEEMRPEGVPLAELQPDESQYEYDQSEIHTPYDGIAFDCSEEMRPEGVPLAELQSDEFQYEYDKSEEVQSEIPTPDDGVGNFISGTDVEEATAENEYASLEPLLQLRRKNEPRSKRILSLITERSYDNLSKVSRAVGCSFNELLNDIIQQYLETWELYDISEEELSKRLDHF